MRLFEFTDDLDGVIEDEADARGDAALLTTLEVLRNQSAGKHLVPRVQANTLINIVNNQGTDSSYTLKSLLDAYKTNEAVKNLIADIKDDDDGVKYVYLQPIDGEELGGDLEGSTTSSEPDKIVSKMADKAIANRS